MKHAPQAYWWPPAEMQPLEEPRPVLPRKIGMTLLGMLICWALNLAELGISFWIFVLAGERFLAPFYVLIGGIGLLQIAYIVPIYRLLRRKNLPEAARGLALAACLTALLNAGFDWAVFRHMHSLSPPPRAQIFTIYLARKD